MKKKSPRSGDAARLGHWENSPTRDKKIYPESQLVVNDVTSVITRPFLWIQFTLTFYICGHIFIDINPLCISDLVKVENSFIKLWNKKFIDINVERNKEFFMDGEKINNNEVKIRDCCTFEIFRCSKKNTFAYFMFF